MLVCAPLCALVVGFGSAHAGVVFVQAHPPPNAHVRLLNRVHKQRQRRRRRRRRQDPEEVEKEEEEDPEQEQEADPEEEEELEDRLQHKHRYMHRRKPRCVDLNCVTCGVCAV